MFHLPSTEKHFQERQAEFNRQLYHIYDDAKEIVEERATQYDAQRPVWERVSFPHGFMHEVTKKIGRIRAQIDQGEKCMVPDRWAHTRTDILDAANYLLFLAVYGDMLHDEMFPTLKSVEEFDSGAAVEAVHSGEMTAEKDWAAEQKTQAPYAQEANDAAAQDEAKRRAAESENPTRY